MTIKITFKTDAFSANPLLVRPIRIALSIYIYICNYKLIILCFLKHTCRFKVHYYDKNANGDGKTKVGEGEIIYIRPRHPDKGSTPTLRCEAWNDVDIDLERSLWGTGPELSAKEADRLTFCCCECCHGDTCRGFSEAVCGAFPQHVTINQCFTPSMFSAYHREGYRSSMEAKVEEFMSDEDYDAISTAFVV